MELVVFGVNHVSAPLAVREALYLGAPRMAEFLTRWHTQHPDDELVGLCTCNRTEMYAISPAGAGTLEKSLPDRLGEAAGAGHDAFMKHAYTHIGSTAVEHLFRVASGIDSMVIGESQILSQLRQAYSLAKECSATGALMNELMDRALRVGKRARTETEIGAGNLSVASVAVSLAERVFSHLARQTVLLLGAGETAELTARHLLDAGVREILVANRTPERAKALVETLQKARVVPFDPLAESLAHADIVMCATGSEKPVITGPLVREVMSRRGGRMLVFLDLSVPRNVDPAVESIEQVIAYDIDSLQAICEQGKQRREAEIAKVERIIAEEAGKFAQWYSWLEAESLLSAMRRRFEEIRRNEIEKYGKKFQPEDLEQLEKFTQSLSNKFLHDLTINLRRVNRESRDGLALLDAVDRLFNLSGAREKDEEEKK